MSQYECGLATQAIEFLETGRTNSFAYAVRLSLPRRGQDYPARQFNMLLNRVRNIAARRKGCRELVLQASPPFIRERFTKAEQRAAKRREKKGLPAQTSRATSCHRLKPGIEVDVLVNPYRPKAEQLAFIF